MLIMGQSIPIHNGILSICDIDFNCPACGYPHQESDYLASLTKSKYGLCYRKCKGCKTLLGVTFDMRGDVKVSLKSEEKK